MGWRIDASVGRRLRSSISTMETMRGTMRVLRKPMDPRDYRAFLTDTLMLRDEDMSDAHAIDARIGGTIGMDCLMPDAVAEGNLQVSATSLALARHMGVDPVRLMLAAHDAKPRAVDGDQTIAVCIERAFGRQKANGVADRLDIRIGLAPGATWRGARLSMRRTQLPEAMTAVLAGRMLTDVLAHPWEGWHGVRITGALRKGDSLIIDTDATRMVGIGDLQAA